LLVALVKTVSWTQQVGLSLPCVQTQTKGFGDGREFGGGSYCTATTAPQRYFSELAGLQQVDWANPIADRSGYSDRISPGQ